MTEREKVEEELRQKRQELTLIIDDWAQTPVSEAAEAAYQQLTESVGEQIKALERELAGLDLLEQCDVG